MRPFVPHISGIVFSELAVASGVQIEGADAVSLVHGTEKKRRRRIMKTKLLALLLLAGSTMFAGSVHIAVGIGPGYGYGYYAPPPPPRAYYAPPPIPGPGYTWVNGYYYPVGARYHWRGGYWARPPYVGARWYGPRYYGGRYYHGYWRR
jgi:hypothetical protein